mmetsp:Transcript_9714/g.18731  ORF Transcript_9714/g.18731 Transcript_9714/m.18731 type:complete len:268 (+) Transcript_9714:954-1757(+)
MERKKGMVSAAIRDPAAHQEVLVSLWSHPQRVHAVVKKTVLLSSLDCCVCANLPPFGRVKAHRSPGEDLNRRLEHPVILEKPGIVWVQAAHVGPEAPRQEDGVSIHLQGPRVVMVPPPCNHCIPGTQEDFRVVPGTPRTLLRPHGPYVRHLRQRHQNIHVGKNRPALTRKNAAPFGIVGPHKASFLARALRHEPAVGVVVRDFRRRGHCRHGGGRGGVVQGGGGGCPQWQWRQRSHNQGVGFRHRQQLLCLAIAPGHHGGLDKREQT